MISRRSPRRWLNTSLGALALLTLAACSEDTSAAPDISEVLVRERVAHWFEKTNRVRAREVLAPLVAREDASAEDLLRAAAIEFALSEAEAAQAFLARAELLEPDSAALHFLRGQMLRESGELERAALELRAALAAAPDDVPTKYTLASTLQDLDQFEEAEGLLREVLALGIQNTGGWYVSALYRLERLLLFDDREDEAKPLREQRLALDKAGNSPPSAVLTRLGTYGTIVPPAAFGTSVPRPLASLDFQARELELPELAGALKLQARDLDADGRLDLVARFADGVVTALARDAGWEVLRAFDGPSSSVLALDVDNAEDAQHELLIVSRGELLFRKLSAGAWQDQPIACPTLDSPARDVEAVDFDHEGDIDLLLVGDFGARLWRNDGAASAGGAFVDASERAGLPAQRAYHWALSEDLDNDGDVDLLVGGSEGAYLADSLRGGNFVDASSRLPVDCPLAREPIVADFDGDALPDLFTPGPQAQLWRQVASGSFAAARAAGSTPLVLSAADLDLDGSLDLIWGKHALLAAGLEVQTRAQLNGVEDVDSAPQVVCDLDGDLKPDVLHVGPESLTLFVAQGQRGHGTPVIVRGARSNRRAVGTRLEVRSGESYRRIFLRGEPLLVGSGAQAKLDVLRLTYPNGIVLSEIDVPSGAQSDPDDPEAPAGLRSEPEGLIGSCPFLYAWNGERYEFITDVLGITPLGLPLAPGVLVPPDHDEFVLVRGDQLVEREGELVVQFTEELREVTYLDRVRLDVVDHPLGTEIFPNELFRFPPFPEEHTHTLRAPLAPTRAMGSDGRDWRAEVAVADSLHAVPFEKQAPQFQGLAKGWFLELEFDAERVAQADKLRLAMTGWFFWSDASSNMAAAGQPGVDFVPPLFQVPDGAGGWRDAGAPVGFPAGKTKTMVIDVSDLGLQQDPRLRVFCTLQLYWDRIALAVDDDDAELRVQSLEPQSAQLSLRGFSAPLDTGREDLPLRFDWDVLAKAPRWNQHPGLYTKLGECVALLGEVDDRYIIMGSGEALEVRFDARELAPVPAGFTRDYLLYLDGWAKDRDPNTLEALRVEPLPFHAMSGYPYGPDEHFPDDQAHRAWAAEWNTRAGLEWIVPLSQPQATFAAGDEAQ